MPPSPVRAPRREPRVLLITGASSGIGLAVAHLAAEAGDHLVLVARDEGALKTTADECAERGAASTMVVPADVGDDEAVRACVAAVLDRHGRLDAVVSNAGVVAYGRAEEIPVEVFDGVLRTNLTGSMNLARHVLPVMRRQRAGSLVLVGSVLGHIAVPTMTPYAVSKWGIRALARQLQLENRDVPQLHIGYVAPGGVLTPIYEQAANHDGWAGRPPPPVAQPERVAKVVLRLLDRPRTRVQVGPLNGVMRLGFTVLPGIYDVLVGPAFRLVCLDLTKPVAATVGNVLASQPELNRLYGNQAPALTAVPRNLAARVRSGRGAAR